MPDPMTWHVYSYEGERGGVHRVSLCNGTHNQDHECLGEVYGATEEAAYARARDVAAAMNEVDRLRSRLASALDQNEAIAANVARMMPVVEAAVAWRKWMGGVAWCDDPSGRLADAVDAMIEKETET